MKVVIPIPGADPSFAAAQALEMEGIDFHAHLLLADEDYGCLFADLWDEGREFIVIEHDIVPWPGAVEQLASCGHPWCTHRYPLHQGKLGLSFGIGKYRPIGPAPSEWRRTPWRLLDGAVLPEVRKVLGASHVHHPPVAHSRSVVAA